MSFYLTDLGSGLLSHFCQFQVNCAKSALSPSQRILFLGTVIDSNEGGSHTRTCTGHSAARGLIQTRSPSPSQSVSEDDGPHGLSLFGTSVARPWVESTLPFRALRIYIEPLLGSRKSSLYALAAPPRGLQSQSRDYPDE